MTSSPQKNTKTPNGFTAGCIAGAAMLILSSLAKMSLWLSLCAFGLTIAVLWLYFRVLRSNQPGTIEQNEEALRGKIFEEIADALPRAIAILDRDAKIVHANSAAQKLLSPDMLGRPLSAYLPASPIDPIMDQIFEGEIPPTLSEHISHPAELYLDVDFSQSISVQSDSSGKAVVFAVLADRTLAEKERELRADFLANASHELKTPIASIKGYIETLRGHAKDDPIAREKFLGIMAEQADRMERLVTDLLSLRRIESIEHIAPSETADLRKAIVAAQDALNLLAATRDIQLLITLPDTASATTSGKTDECVQLFLNLMENAIKLSPKGSFVRITLEHLPSWSGEAFPEPTLNDAEFRCIVHRSSSSSPVWRVVISDEGPGLAREHLPRIGERFYRIAGDLPAQEKGTGLGLAIVKHIAVRNRAGLFVKTTHADRNENTPSGTSFSVVFSATNPTP